MAVFDDGGPRRAAVVDDRSASCFVQSHEGFAVTAPCCTCEGFEIGIDLLCFGSDVFGVRFKADHRDEDVALHENLRLLVGMSGLRSEKGDCRLVF